MSYSDSTVSILLFIGTVIIIRTALSLPAAFVTKRYSTRVVGKALVSNTGGMPELPTAVVQYAQVPANGKYFTATTIPKGLLKEHSTKKGTWGVIRVSQGRLEYQINEPTLRKFEIDRNCQGIIEPKILHQVKSLTADLEFVVEFYRLPGTGAVDEKRE